MPPWLCREEEEGYNIMSLRRVLTSAAVSAVIVGSGVMTAPVARAAGETPTATAAIAATQASSAPWDWLPYPYPSMSACRAAGDRLLTDGVITAYWCVRSGDYVLLYVWR